MCQLPKPNCSLTRCKKSLLLLLLLLTDYQERLDADDEDDDDEDLFDHSMLLMLIKHNKLWSGPTRLTKMRPNRINFVEHVSRLRRQNRFSRMYHMNQFHSPNMATQSDCCGHVDREYYEQL